MQQALISIRHIEIDVLSFHQTVPNTATFARGMVFGSPLLDEIRSHTGGDPLRIHEALSSAMQEEFGLSPCTVPMQAIVFTRPVLLTEPASPSIGVASIFRRIVRCIPMSNPTWQFRCRRETT